MSFLLCLFQPVDFPTATSACGDFWYFKFSFSPSGLSGLGRNNFLFMWLDLPSMVVWSCLRFYNVKFDICYLLFVYCKNLVDRCFQGNLAVYFLIYSYAALYRMRFWRPWALDGDSGALNLSYGPISHTDVQFTLCSFVLLTLM